MAIYHRKSEERGAANHGWLDTKYSFSFSNYYDPNFMGFGPLRVINDDRIAGGGGFPTHPHDNMEIVTYVLEGALAHKDSMGNGTTINAGDVQRMSAGTGVRHSEFNASDKIGVHLLQIWIMPDKDGYEPSYEQKQFTRGDKLGNLRLVASNDGRDGSVSIHQKANIYAAIFNDGDSAELNLAKGQGVWVQVAKGGIVVVNDTELKQGDGLAIWETDKVTIKGKEEAEFLVFELG
ncbi:pirin family protein [Pseudaquidulcibacter saccharophilus]|uniref:pirin family protein n=1 Tax=Pseudaquidulcibacter saccharophilus TaxID=2831900 RepID=UPI001EFF0D60|nr:pirin family protein [Pseudaquidulcibacter saccharophilus]